MESCGDCSLLFEKGITRLFKILESIIETPMLLEQFEHCSGRGTTTTPSRVSKCQIDWPFDLVRLDLLAKYMCVHINFFW